MWYNSIIGWWIIIVKYIEYNPATAKNCVIRSFSLLTGENCETIEEKLKKVFEDEKIEKYGYNLAQDYILLKQIGITMKNIVYDAKIAAYILDPTSKYEIDIIVREYLEMDNDELLEAQGIQESNKQTSLFENMSDENADNTSKIKAGIYAKEIFEL